MALELPAPLRESLAAWAREQAAGREDLRPLAGESLHVTLVFLGSLSPDAVAEAGEVVLAHGAPVRGLSLGAPLWLPPRQPRVLAVGVGDPAGDLAGLQSALSAGLAERVAHRPERRRFRPHVTVARRRSGRGGSRREADLPGPRAAAFDGEAVVLYRSKLGGRSASYESLVRVGAR